MAGKPKARKTKVKRKQTAKKNKSKKNKSIGSLTEMQRHLNLQERTCRRFRPSSNNRLGPNFGPQLKNTRRYSPAFGVLTASGRRCELARAQALRRSLSGAKRTCPFAAHMSAYDLKRTWASALQTSAYHLKQTPEGTRGMEIRNMLPVRRKRSRFESSSNR